MSDNTKIEWTDATWNIITGCSVVSAGCKNCYAMKLAGTRLKHHPSRAGLTIDTKNGPVWSGNVRFNGPWLDQPLNWSKPRMIFVCAHGDLFHESVPFEWIDRVYAVMALASQHIFQVLTKRPERMREYLSSRNRLGNSDICREINEIPAHFGDRRGALEMPLPNVWLGVSVENQEAADKRIPILLDTPAAVRWISAEPLLGKINLSKCGNQNRQVNALTGTETTGNPISSFGISGFDQVTRYNWTNKLDWVVVGGESGSGARPMHPEWARSLRDQCAAAGVRFLFKQWGEWAPVHELKCNEQGIKGKLWHNFDPDTSVCQIGKKAAGRMLDGVEHNGYPKNI